MSSRIKLLERSLAVRVRSISRVVQEVMHSVPSVAAATEAGVSALSLNPPSLRIAKTTLPDTRMDFNDTFQHIRCGLDVFYKERNPIFDNTIAATASLAETVNERQHAEKSQHYIASTLKGASVNACLVLEDVKTPALWISRTVVPAERPSFNDTFQHVRCKLDEFYKERNPIFHNTIASDTSASESVAAAEQQQVCSTLTGSFFNVAAVSELWQKNYMELEEARQAENFIRHVDNTLESASIKKCPDGMRQDAMPDALSFEGFFRNRNTVKWQAPPLAECSPDVQIPALH